MANILMAFSIPMILLIGSLGFILLRRKNVKRRKRKNKKQPEAFRMPRAAFYFDTVLTLVATSSTQEDHHII